MAQSLSDILLHIVFSTKDRKPLLQNVALRERLHAYLAVTATALDSPSMICNGVSDHVHLLVNLSRKITVSNLVQELKVSSSKWLKEQSDDLGRFQWQGGYSAFSVSRSQVERVRIYIAKQEEHHRRATYQDELRVLLLKHGVAFDEKYLWS